MKIWHVYRNGRPVPATVDGVGRPAWPGRPLQPVDELAALLGPGVAMSLPSMLHEDALTKRPPDAPRY